TSGQATCSPLAPWGRGENERRPVLSHGQGALGMSFTLALPLALAAGLLTPLSARATGTAVLTGGNHEVKEVRNLAYYEGEGADPVRHKLDLYLPKDGKDFP